MPEAIGENIPIVFKCLCCKIPVQVWAFMPIHPGSSNTELLPKQWRQPYRQDWYVNPEDDRIFDDGQLWQIEFLGPDPVLTAVTLVSDGNPFVNGLVRIPEQGIGRGRAIWTCGPCSRLADRDRTMMWHYIMFKLKPLP